MCSRMGRGSLQELGNIDTRVQLHLKALMDILHALYVAVSYLKHRHPSLL